MYIIAIKKSDETKELYLNIKNTVTTHSLPNLATVFNEGTDAIKAYIDNLPKIREFINDPYTKVILQEVDIKPSNYRKEIPNMFDL